MFNKYFIIRLKNFLIIWYIKWVYLPEIIDTNLKSQRILKNFLRSKNSPFDASKGIVGILIFLCKIRCFSRFCIKEYWQRYRSSFPLQSHDKSGKIHCFNHLKDMWYWLLMNKQYFSNNIIIFFLVSRTKHLLPCRSCAECLPFLSPGNKMSIRFG